MTRILRDRTFEHNACIDAMRDEPVAIIRFWHAIWCLSTYLEQLKHNVI